MITHYDMTTGEVITDELAEQPGSITAESVAIPALRLLTVEEANAAQAGTAALPTCMAMIPVDLLLSKQP